MSETIILIMVVSNMLITPIIQYMLSSRCYEINCCGCISCLREPIELKAKDIKDMSNNNDKK
jgi:hypothetical protein